MSTRVVSIIIEGQAGETFKIRVADFLRELRSFLQVLNETDRFVNSQREPINEYKIIDLSHSSPATIVIEAVPCNPDVDTSEKVVSELKNIFTKIKKGENFDYPVSTSLLTSIQEMTSPIGRTLSKVGILANGDVINIDDKFRNQIVYVLSEEETFPGSIRGMLEEINIHKSANLFRLYPDVGPHKITCHFPAELYNQAILAVGKFIEVKGILKYKKASPYAHHIDVEEITIFAPDDQLPSFNELLGIAPDATGDLSSEEFIRRLRNAST